MKPLSTNSKKALQHIELKLRQGFTGSFTLICQEGGVRHVEQNEQFNANELLPDKETAPA